MLEPENVKLKKDNKNLTTKRFGDTKGEDQLNVC